MLRSSAASTPPLASRSHLKNACNLILKNARKNSLIIIESTTYPGTTDEIFIPKLDKKFQNSYFISYSPEREDPGNKKFTTKCKK